MKPIIRPGTLCLFYGEPGSKKTFSLVDLAVRVATGMNWLGMEVKKGPVLFIDEEMGPKRIGSRIGNSLRANTAGADVPIIYTSMAGINLGDKVHVSELERVIISGKVILVIIDAFVDVTLGADENSVKEIMPISR